MEEPTTTELSENEIKAMAIAKDHLRDLVLTKKKSIGFINFEETKNQKLINVF